MSVAAMRKLGIALTVLLALFLAMDVGMKLLALAPELSTSAEMGWPADAGTARALGAVLLVCLVLYLVPRTSVLGAILLTGYLGGSVATHARIGDPLLSHTLFGVYLGVIAWVALWLRNDALRALIPLRAPRET
jgi:hypothetical protein